MTAVVAGPDLFQQWLDTAAQLRGDMLRSEAEFYDFLVRGEQGACPWQGKYTSFIQVIETTNLCSPQRYAAYRDALRVVGPAVVAKTAALGVDGLMLAGRMAAVPQAAFVARVEAGYKQQGCPLSVRRIKEIAHEVAPRGPLPHRGPARAEGACAQCAPLVTRLRREIAKLRAKNTALQAENKKLRAKK
jgi:hypothetical protein